MRERRQTLLGSVLALTFVSLLVTPLAAFGASGLPATISMNPATAGPGTRVEVVGLDFAAGQDVDLQLTTTTGPIHLATATTEDGGYFRHSVTLPADVAPGFWELRATGPGGAVAVLIFEAGEAVLAAAPVEAADATLAAAGGSTSGDLLVVLVLLLLVGGIAAAAGFVYYQTHRSDDQPGMAAGEDPIWSGAHSDT